MCDAAGACMDTYQRWAPAVSYLASLRGARYASSRDDVKAQLALLAREVASADGLQRSAAAVADEAITLRERFGAHVCPDESALLRAVADAADTLRSAGPAELAAAKASAADVLYVRRTLHDAAETVAAALGALSAQAAQARMAAELALAHRRPERRDSALLQLRVRFPACGRLPDSRWPRVADTPGPPIASPPPPPPPPPPPHPLVGRPLAPAAPAPPLALVAPAPPAIEVPPQSTDRLVIRLGEPVRSRALAETFQGAAQPRLANTVGSLPEGAPPAPIRSASAPAARGGGIGGIGGVGRRRWPRIRVH